MSKDNLQNFAHIDGKVTALLTIKLGKVTNLEIQSTAIGLEKVKDLAGKKSKGSKIIVTVVPPKYQAFKVIDLDLDMSSDEIAEQLANSKKADKLDTATTIQIYPNSNPQDSSSKVQGVGLVTPSGWLSELGLIPYNIVAVPHVFIFNKTDGLHLHIGWNSADVTSIKEGRIIATKSLKCGGLSRVAKRLGPYGEKLVLDEMRGVASPASSSELLLYFEGAIEEYLEVISDWEERELISDSKLQIYGFGTLIPMFYDALNMNKVEARLDKETLEQLSLLPKEKVNIGSIGLLTSKRVFEEGEFILMPNLRKRIKAIKLDDAPKRTKKLQFKKIFVALIGALSILYAAYTFSNSNQGGVVPPSERASSNEMRVEKDVENKENSRDTDRELEIPKNTLPSSEPSTPVLSCDEYFDQAVRFIKENPIVLKEDTINDKNGYMALLNKFFESCKVEEKNNLYEKFYKNEFLPWATSNEIYIKEIDANSSSNSN